MLDDVGSYAISDYLLFSQETYFRLFELLYEVFWPLHLLLAVAGGLLIVLLRGHAGQRRAGWPLLAILWIWVAWAFHLERYASINLAAPYFAGLFFIEAALLFAAAGLTRSAGGDGVDGPPASDGPSPKARTRVFLPPASRAERSTPFRAGTGLLIYAVLLHPLTGFLAGRAWTELAFFGMSPDPTAVGTLGAVLLAGDRLPRWLRWLLLVPALLWCIVSALTAYAMSSVEAVPLLAVILFSIAASIGGGASVHSPHSAEASAG